MLLCFILFDYAFMLYIICIFLIQFLLETSNHGKKIRILLNYQNQDMLENQRFIKTEILSCHLHP